MLLLMTGIKNGGNSHLRVPILSERLVNSGTSGRLLPLIHQSCGTTSLQGQSPTSDDFAKNDPAWAEARRRKTTDRNLRRRSGAPDQQSGRERCVDAAAQPHHALPAHRVLPCGPHRRSSA